MIMRESAKTNCLFNIFKQIKSKCEIEKQIRYADLDRFAISLEYIRNQFYHWDKNLYECLEMDKHKEQGSKLTIDFDLMYDGLQISTEIERDFFWKSLTSDIKENINLKRVTMKCTLDSFYEKYSNFIGMIINALENKQFLEHLSLDRKGYTLKNLPHIPQLKELHLNVKLNADELIELCKTNPNLLELFILNDNISGKLADIVLDNDSLRKLEVLDFQMRPEIHAEELTPLAKLLKLDYLRIRGQHRIGSLKNLFVGLATKRKLRFLYMDDAILSTKEIGAISQIDSLEELKCGFTELESIGELSQMRELTELRITSKHYVPKMLQQILKILIESPLHYISIHFHDGKMNYDKPADMLTWELFVMDVDASEYAVLSEIPNLRGLHITGLSNRISSLPNLLEAISGRTPQTLQHLRLSSSAISCQDKKIPDIALTCRDILGISAIESLKSLEFSIADMSNIYVLGNLRQLEKLILNIPSTQGKEEMASLKKLFLVLASKASSTLEHLDLSGASVNLASTIELARIKSLKSLKCGFAGDDCIQFLHLLTRLENLEIKSEHNFNEVSQWILKILTSSNTSIKINSIAYDSLAKELVIRLPHEANTDAISFSPLGNLENCHRLFVYGKCKRGSIYPLLETLSNSQNHSLQVLNLECIAINYEETLLVSQIQTLKAITCEFSDPRSFEISHTHSDYKRIKLNGRLFPYQIFNFLNNSKGAMIIENNDRQITYYKNQGKLILKNVLNDKEAVVDASDYACLGNLNNLRVVHIIGENKSGSLVGLFHNLAASESLKELIVDGDAVANYSSEFLELAKIKSLQKLKCGFLQAPNVGILVQLQNLRELTITPHQCGSLRGLFQELSSQTALALQVLSIENGVISYSEMKAIARIKSLKRLKCEFINTESDDGLPLLPHLTELCIKGHTGSGLFTEPGFFDNSALQAILIMGGPLDVEDLTALAQHKRVRKLQISLRHLENIDLLSVLDELEDLHIELIGDFNSLVALPHSPKYPANINKLAIKNCIMDCKDLEKTVQLLALKSLDCLLYIEENTRLCGLDRLEELTIRLPRDGSTKTLLQALTQKTPSILKHLAIMDDLLDMEDVLQLSQIHSLNTLRCGLLHDDSLRHLVELINLETLTITSDYYIDDVSNHLLNIIRACTKLEFIDLTYCDEEIDRKLIDKVLDVLKSVRDPIMQNPLKLRISDYPGYPEEQLNAVGQKYLTIEKIIS